MPLLITPSVTVYLMHWLTEGTSNRKPSANNRPALIYVGKAETNKNPNLVIFSYT